MACKRDGFVPIGDVVAGVDLPGVPVPTRRDRAPQARRHFTQLDQVTQLVAASEADADLGFMARMLALCSLPRTNLGDQLQYVRRNGPLTLAMTAGVNNKLPYGNLPRLLLAWVCTEAVRTQRRELILGDSLSAFMRSVGVYNSGGAARSRLQEQMRRLFNSYVQLVYEDEHGEASVNSLVADRAEFWWNTKRPDDRTLWESKIELGEKFFEEVIHRPVPLDLNTLKSLKRSSLGLDLYLWLTYRTFALKRPLRLTWPQLYRQFGADPAKSSNTRTVDAFRTDCLRELKKNQGRLAGPALPDGQGGAGCLALVAAHRAVATAPRGIALSHQVLGSRFVDRFCGGGDVRRAILNAYLLRHPTIR